jgi:hypothetical protein
MRLVRGVAQLGKSALLESPVMQTRQNLPLLLHLRRVAHILLNRIVEVDVVKVYLRKWARTGWFKLALSR